MYMAVLVNFLKYHRSTTSFPCFSTQENIYFSIDTEAYSRYLQDILSQISKMELFANIRNCSKPLGNFLENFHVRCLAGF